MADLIYTRAERAQRARLVLKGAKGAYGDTSRIEAQIDRIDQTAADRARRETAAWHRQHETAKDEVAAARVAERTADRTNRATAKADRAAAEKRLRAIERTRP